MNLTPTPTPALCGNCSADERRLLHHVRHRGVFRRLCTNCVLRLHAQSFCPTCFLFSTPSTSPSGVDCAKCLSSSHSHCVPPSHSHSHSSPYVCPLCQNPNSPIFDAKRTPDGNSREVDNKSAKVLLCAARIAAASMTKAAVATRMEAEKRAREAALAKKRAREALEHVAFLVAKEKEKEKSRRKDSSVSAAVDASRNQKGGNGGVGVGAVVAKSELGGIGPNEVSARLNAVGLREEGLQGFGGHNNGAVKGVQDSERLRVSSGVNVARGALVRNNEDEKTVGDLGQLEKNYAQGENVNNGLYAGTTSVGDEDKHMQNNGGREEKMGSQQ